MGYTPECVCGRDPAPNAFSGVFRAQGTCLVAANIVPFLSNKTKQMWLFLNVLYAIV